MVPETHYARSGDAHIAYQVFGDGPVDLVVFGALASHVELIWEDPSAARFLNRLSRFSRVIMFDKLGVGMSDPTPGGDSTFEQRLDDCRAVLDTVRCDDAVFFGISEGGALAVLMAASDPKRVRGIVTFSAYARLVAAADYPEGVDREIIDALVRRLDKDWNPEFVLSVVLPSVMHSQPKKQFWLRYFRQAITPGQFRLQVEQNAVADIRAALPLIQAPALVIHGVDDRWIPISNGRYLAAKMPNARLIELPTGDHLPYTDVGLQVADEIEEFVTGSREAAEPDRQLATIMFSDIVDSTATAAANGDKEWLDRLQRHDDVVRSELHRFRGTEISHTGDGFLAMFDGPARAIRCGQAIHTRMEQQGLTVRIGLHTGEVELRGHDVGGIAVHIAARVASAAGPGEILVSQSIPPLVVGSGLEFASTGRQTLKGVPGEWELFSAKVSRAA